MRISYWRSDVCSSDLTTATNAQDILDAEYSNLESTVNAALGSLGAEVRALELQTSFLEQISDATEEGLGNIVDADLARESARLTALQVQQQLSIQTLGIANQRPQSLLGLFRYQRDDADHPEPGEEPKSGGEGK